MAVKCYLQTAKFKRAASLTLTSCSKFKTQNATDDVTYIYCGSAFEESNLISLKRLRALVAYEA